MKNLIFINGPMGVGHQAAIVPPAANAGYGYHQLEPKADGSAAGSHDYGRG
ncbi:MAG: hypothetical protein ACOX2K_04465 [Bacillota bacterium]